MGVVWIASYPKSGNTWMRFLLANYLSGPIQDSGQVEALIPDLSKRRDLSGLLSQRPGLYSKTHFVWSERHPYADLTEKSVVIVRHPKDVLLSNLNYRKFDRAIERQFTDEQYAQAFIENCGDPQYIVGGVGTLELNVRSWLDAGFPKPRLLVRYEDMKANTEKVLGEVVAFLGLAVDQERLRMAVKQSSFDQMRAIEVRERREKSQGSVFPGEAPRQGRARYFMNEGKTRGSLKHLGPAIDAAFDSTFGPLMDSLEYPRSA